MVPSLGTLFSIPPPRRRGNLESCSSARRARRRQGRRALGAGGVRAGSARAVVPQFRFGGLGASVLAYCCLHRWVVRTRKPVMAPDCVIVIDSTLVHQVDLFAGLSPGGFCPGQLDSDVRRAPSMPSGSKSCPEVDGRPGQLRIRPREPPHSRRLRTTPSGAHYRGGALDRLSRTSAPSSVDDNFHRARIGRPLEDVIGANHVVQAKMVGAELTRIDLTSCDQAEQGRCRVGVNQAGRDGDVTDPQRFEVKRGRLAVYPYVRHLAARTNEVRAESRRWPGRRPPRWPRRRPDRR